MNDWNMPVIMSILLIEDICWLLNDNTLKFKVVIFQKLLW